MVGRGFRLCPGKQDCLVLDFGGNVMRHGPVDDLRLGDRNPTGREAPMKECASCNALVPTASRECPECGHAFPEPERERHDPTATTEAVLRSRGPRRSTPVLEVRYFVHRKLADPEAPPSMRVEYRTGLGTFQREWVCLAHPEGSFARRKAEEWWRLRSDMPLPGSVEDAVWLASQGALAACTGIVVTRKPGERYDRISSHELGPIPAWNDTASQIRTIPEVPDDGIPI
jgi:DNA repair protein RadD